MLQNNYDKHNLHELFKTRNNVKICNFQTLWYRVLKTVFMDLVYEHNLCMNTRHSIVHHLNFFAVTLELSYTFELCILSPNSVKQFVFEYFKLMVKFSHL